MYVILYLKQDENYKEPRQNHTSNRRKTDEGKLGKITREKMSKQY